MSKDRTPEMEYELDTQGRDNIDEVLKDDLVESDFLSDQNLLPEPADERTSSLVLYLDEDEYVDEETLPNLRDFHRRENFSIKTNTTEKDEEEFRKFCHYPEFRLSLIKSDSESSAEKEKGVMKFRKYAHQVYPKSYLKRLWELLYKDKGENENRVLQSLLRLPLVTKVTLDAIKAFNEVKEIIEVNSTMKGLCETLISFFNRLAKFGEIKLKDLENCSQFKLPRLTFLLVGERGTGKSWIGRTLADILGVPSVYIDCANTDFLNLVGSSFQWSNSGEGILARELIREGTFPVIVIFDEIDKAGEANSHALVDTVSHIIDPEKTFKDEFLDVPLLHYKLSIFILTANDINVFPDYFISRCIPCLITPIAPELRYKVVLKGIPQMLEKLELPKHELAPLFEDKAIMKRVVTVIGDLDLDIREVKQRFEVALLRYQFHLEISGNREVKFIDILFEELEGTLSSKKLTKTKGKKKVGFL